MMELITQKKINPLITQTFSFDESVDAIEHLNSRKAMGKVVIQVNGNLT